MPGLCQSVLVCILASPSTISEDLSYSSPHFRNWFPGYRNELVDALQESCMPTYERYVNAQQFWDNVNIVTCLLDNVRGGQGTQYTMGAAAVLLGVLPTVLGLISSSPAEIGLLWMQRPFLGFLLSSGCPTILLARSVDYARSTKELPTRESHRDELHFDILGRRPIATATIQYFLALGLLANLVELTWELTVRTSYATFLQAGYMPILYVLLALATQLAACIAVRLRLRVEDVQAPPQALLVKLRSLLSKELSICAAQHPWMVAIRPLSYSFLFVSWATSIGTVLVILLGTSVFSSTLFVGPSDAIKITGRWLINVVVSRLVLVFELEGMRLKATIGTEQATGIDREEVEHVQDGKP